MMHRLLFLRRLAFVVLFAALFATGCSQTETIVIDQDPSVQSDTATADTADRQRDADFQQIVIGEYHPISTLDPLFALNTSTMRTLQYIYEGLVRFNQDSDIIPGMAQSWEVSSDSTEYAFTLKDNIYYHDSSAFANGIGRRMVADDIRYIFERMARLTVPNHAAQLFMDIQGFEPYYREQQQLYIPEQRNIQGVSGIETPNDSTVVFTLNEKDANFLQKLASPYALIYPREAVVLGAPSAFRPIGTGPFRFSEVQNSNRIIFSRFDEYYNRSNIELNRVDVFVNINESELFKSFASGNIHLIPEIGPQMAEGLLATDDRLQPNYRDIYRLHVNSGQLTLRLNHHPEGKLDREQALTLASLADSTMIPTAPTTDFFEISSPIADTLHPDSLNLPQILHLVYTDNPYASWLSNKLNEKISGQQSAIAVQNTRTTTRDTDLYYTDHLRFYPTDTAAPSSNVLLEFTARHLGLSQQKTENIRFNNYPWWIDIRTTAISDS